MDDIVDQGIVKMAYSNLGLLARNTLRAALVVAALVVAALGVSAAAMAADNYPVPASPHPVFGAPVSIAPGAGYGDDPAPPARKASAVSPRQAVAHQSRSEHLGPLSATVLTANSFGTFIQSGHSGAWSTDLQDGRDGMFIQVIPHPDPQEDGNLVTLAWFAYHLGEPVWIVAVAPILRTGNLELVIFDGYIYRGGEFPPLFQIDQVTKEYWGSLTLDFRGCDEARIEWGSIFSSGSALLQRLTQVSGTQCSPDQGGSAGLDDDYGDSIDAFNVGFISSGPPEGGTLEVTGDRDVFFTGLGGVVFPPGPCTATVTAWTTGSTDTYGRLYQVTSTNGRLVETLLGEDDDDGEGLNFWIRAEDDFLVRNPSLTSGYSIHVSGYNDSTTGPYTVWLESRCGTSARQVQINFENQLATEIIIYQNGNAVGRVPPNETRGEPLAVNEGDQFSFLSDQPFGDRMEGIYPRIQDTSVPQINYRASHIIGDQWFFFPVVTNNTTGNRLLGVNMGLQAENRCNCLIVANSVTNGGGYYLLFSNSNLRLYQEGSRYTGQYWQWTDFSRFAESGSGIIRFTLD